MPYMAPGTRCLLLLALLAATLATSAEAARPGRRSAPDATTTSDGLHEVVTENYIVRTDLPERELSPILQRLRAMAGEYHDRTSGLSDTSDDRRLPFQLYADLDAYTRAGGAVGSAGVYDGERLLAYVGRRLDASAWHTIQHEAFHQYLGSKLGYEIPIWLNEGLAEYFGESLYTGDGFVSGVVPPFRLKRIRESLDRGQFASLHELLEKSHEQWNNALRQENYDMAWSLVQFLAHGDAGRNQDALTRYIKQSARGADPVRAFEDAIGSVTQVEQAWVEYWQNLPEEEVRLKHADVAVKTVCSYLARAVAMRSRPADADELLALARNGELPQPAGQELPVDVLIDCLTWSRRLGEWHFDHAPRAEANVTLQLDANTLVQAKYATRPGRFQQVETWTASPQTAPSRGSRRPTR